MPMVMAIATLVGQRCHLKLYANGMLRRNDNGWLWSVEITIGCFIQPASAYKCHTIVTAAMASATTMKIGTATAIVSVRAVAIAVAMVSVKAVIHDKTSAVLHLGT